MDGLKDYFSLLRCCTFVLDFCYTLYFFYCALRDLFAGCLVSCRVVFIADLSACISADICGLV
jgi:hypothetical protein